MTAQRINEKYLPDRRHFRQHFRPHHVRRGEGLSPVPLFHGYASIHLPSDYVTLKTRVIVPSHQECYINPEGKVVMINLYKRATVGPKVPIEQFHMTEYARAMGASRVEFLAGFLEASLVQHLIRWPYRHVFLTGMRPKYVKARIDKEGCCSVIVRMIVMRLAAYKSDVLIHMDVPTTCDNSDEMLFWDIVNTFDLDTSLMRPGERNASVLRRRR